MKKDCVYTNMGQPENVRKVVALLAKGDFYLTGQMIMVDGGLTILRL